MHKGIKRAWEYLKDFRLDDEWWNEHVEKGGDIDHRDPTAPFLARALLSAVARRDNAEQCAIAAQFRSRADMLVALANIIAPAVGVDHSTLKCPAHALPDRDTVHGGGTGSDE